MRKSFNVEFQAKVALGAIKGGKVRAEFQLKRCVLGGIRKRCKAGNVTC